MKIKKIIIVFVLFITIPSSVFASSLVLDSIDINNIDKNLINELLNSIDEKTINDFKSSIDMNSIDTNSIDINSINENNIAEVYGKLSEALSDEQIEKLLLSSLSNTSTYDKINLLSKFLFSNNYFRIALFFLIMIAIYSIFITSIIFKKASKPSFGTLIPLYRDILHLQICNFSPWVLLLLLIPFIGWLALMAIAVLRKI